jgi:hypothetical protein
VLAVCSISHEAHSDINRGGQTMNRSYFVKCVLWPGNVHGLGPSGFIACSSSVTGV